MSTIGRRKIHGNTTAVPSVVLTAICIHLWCPANGQSLTTGIADQVPMGLRSILPNPELGIFGPAEGFKGGFVYGLGVTSTYDSNFFLESSHPSSELTTQIDPWISYYSDPNGGAPFSLTVNYQPKQRIYLNNPALNGFDQSGNINLKFEGAKTRISAYANYNTISGTDLLTGTFVNGTLLQSGVTGSYQIAPRTSLFANLRYATSDYGSNSLVGSNMYSAEIGGFWSATERFSFGPSVRYTKEESSNTGSRDAWAVSMQTQYLMGEKIRLMASFGLENATYSRSGSGSSMGVTGGLIARYAISERLLWENTVAYVTVPSPSDANYSIKNLRVSSVLTRDLLRGSLTGGLDMNFSNYEQVGTVATSLNNQDNLSVFLSYRRQMFMDRMDFDTTVRHAKNSGDKEWSQWQISAGLYYRF